MPHRAAGAPNRSDLGRLWSSCQTANDGGWRCAAGILPLFDAHIINPAIINNQ
jgi:hypothetical protein